MSRTRGGMYTGAALRRQAAAIRNRAGNPRSAEYHDPGAENDAAELESAADDAADYYADDDDRDLVTA